MYKVSKRMEVAGSHHLNLTYDSPCQNLHGHNWIIVVHCASKKLDENGMVIDFKHIKNAVHDKLDHKNLNDVVDFNPTAENIASWILRNINEVVKDVDSKPFCYKVEVQESEGNTACYVHYPSNLSEWAVKELTLC